MSSSGQLVIKIYLTSLHPNVLSNLKVSLLIERPYRCYGKLCTCAFIYYIIVYCSTQPLFTSFFIYYFIDARSRVAQGRARLNLMRKLALPCFFLKNVSCGVKVQFYYEQFEMRNLLSFVNFRRDFSSTRKNG